MGRRERPPGPLEKMQWEPKAVEIVWLAHRDLTVVATLKHREYLPAFVVLVRQKYLGKKGR